MMPPHPTYCIEMLTERPRLGRNNERSTLTPSEEDAIIGTVLDQRLRGVVPQRADVELMVQDLLTKRGARNEKHLAGRLIRRRPELFTQLPPVDNGQTTLEEDQRALDAWFRLVADTRLRYEIQDGDFYSLDKMGFMLGAVGPKTMATRFEEFGEATSIQPKNQKWATALLSVAADGHIVPPFLWAARQSGHTALYTLGDVPADWAVKTTHDAWTEPETDLNWLRHFDQYTRNRQKGQYRMLMLDGEESHIDPEFDAYCQANRIVLLHLPANWSHLTHPFSVGVFGPLKKAYNDKISILVRADIRRINSGNFFPLFRAAFEAAVTEENVKAGFEKTGLVPFDPDSMVSRLKADTLRTSTSPETYEDLAADENSQLFKTHAAAEFYQTFLLDLYRRPEGCSSVPFMATIELLQELFLTLLHRSFLSRAAARRRAKAEKNLSKLGAAKSAKIHSPVPLTDADSSQPLVKNSSKRRKLNRRHCGICLRTDHNARTCTKHIDVRPSSSE